MGKFFPVIAILLLFACGYLGYDRQSQKREVARLQSDISVLQAELRTQEKVGDAEESEFNSGAGSLKTSTADPKAGKGKKKGPSFASMMENPVIKSQMRTQLKAEVSMEYGKILEDQGFAGDEVAALTDILFDRQVAINEVALKAMGKDPLERSAYSAEAKEIRRSFDEKLKELVGDEEFAELERFDETKAERRQIESLKLQLAGTDFPITPVQEQQLMDVMWEVRQDPRFEGAFGGDVKALSLGTEFPSDPKTLLHGVGELQEEVYNRATFLTPEQAEAFRTNQEGFLQLLKFQVGAGGHGG